jgi:hypothetical protein
MAKEIMNMALRSILVHILKWFFTFHKILRHGADDFFPPEGRRAADFIALKNTSPLLGLNPRSLGLFANLIIQIIILYQWLDSICFLSIMYCISLKIYIRKSVSNNNFL